jgi:hypothetical protein
MFYELFCLESHILSFRKVFQILAIILYIVGSYSSSFLNCIWRKLVGVSRRNSYVTLYRCLRGVMWKSNSSLGRGHVKLLVENLIIIGVLQLDPCVILTSWLHTHLLASWDEQSTKYKSCQIGSYTIYLQVRWVVGLINLCFFMWCKTWCLR